MNSLLKHETSAIYHETSTRQSDYVGLMKKHSIFMGFQQHKRVHVGRSQCLFQCFIQLVGKSKN